MRIYEYTFRIKQYTIKKIIIASNIEDCLKKINDEVYDFVRMEYGIEFEKNEIYYEKIELLQNYTIGIKEYE